MNKIIKSIIPILILIYHVYAYDMIDFDYYQKESEMIQNINQKKLINDIILQKNKDCLIDKKDEDNYLVSPSCLLQNKLPTLEYKEAIDYLRTYIDWFGTIYNENEINFSYEWTFPLFKENLDIYPYSIWAKQTLIDAEKQNKMIHLNKKHIAFYTIRNLWFYATNKDLSILKKCTKQNYTVAIKSFNWTILNPDESINLNKHLSYLQWYCKWTWPQNLKFYWWVCGFITQLFKTSLILPEIEITKRYPHSIRLSAYYSDYIFWDDAAIYEMGKQFEIKNHSKYPIYFKELNRGDSNYFVAILLWKPENWVNITKKQTWKLEWKISIETYNLETKEVTKTTNFISKYDYISNARR